MRATSCLGRIGALTAMLAVMNVSCSGSSKPAEAPGAETSSKVATDYLPQGADLLGHANLAKLRKTPLFVALLGVAKTAKLDAWLEQQAKICEFPFLYAFDDVAFARSDEGDVWVARIGVGLDEMTSCWAKLQSDKMAVAMPEPLAHYEMATVDSMLVLGDAKAVRRVVEGRRRSEHDTRLELDGDEAVHLEGLLEVAPFRDVFATLESSAEGFALRLELETFSPNVAGAVHERLVALREQTLQHAKSQLARDVMKSVRLASSDTKLTLRLGLRGGRDEQLRWVALLVELALELQKASESDAQAAPAR